MKTREITLVSVMVVYVVAVFSFVAYEYSIQFENNKNRPTPWLNCLEMEDLEVLK